MPDRNNHDITVTMDTIWKGTCFLLSCLLQKRLCVKGLMIRELTILQYLLSMRLLRFAGPYSTLPHAVNATLSYLHPQVTPQ